MGISPVKSMSLFRPVDRSEFDRERAVNLADDHHERTKLPPDHTWLLRNVMPIGYEAYCAIVTPWKAHVDGQSILFDEFDCAYGTLFQKGRPADFTLTRWHEDFQVVEFSHELPGLARDLLRRFSRDAPAVFVRADHWEGEQFWRVEADIFFELPDPFAEMPQPFGLFDVFPQLSAWYLVRKDDEPLVYLGGSRGLVDAIWDAIPEKTVRLSLDDRYY